MKLPYKSISIFVCGAVVASLPYTLSMGKANAQTSSTSSSTSKNGGANSSAQASSSQSSFSSSSKNSSASDMVNQLARAGQNASSGGSSSSGEAPIMALTNDDQYVYAAVGNQIHKIRKSDMPSVTFVPQRTGGNIKPWIS